MHADDATQSTNEMLVCKLLMSLEKLTFDKIMSMLQNNWFVISARPSRYGYTRKVTKQLRSKSRTRGQPSATLTLLSNC